MTRHRAALFGALLFILCIAAATTAAERFPRPQMPQDYQYPVTAHPAPRATSMEWIDLTVLIVCLMLAVWFVHRLRSRRGVFILTLFSLAYFGFYRQGCICPIGAIQHVTTAAVSAEYFVPLIPLLFLLLPLIFALFYGRVFCSSVCPLGAVQDLVLVKPLRVPPWLEHALGMLAFVYVGLAVLFAATGAQYIICQYDPFVTFFRLSGPVYLVGLGLSFILIGMFIGRPYCRFFCPLSVLLRWCSRVSRRRVTVTPDLCTRCRLCEDACPYGAIRKPAGEVRGQRRTAGKVRLAFLLLALPCLIALGAALGALTSDFFASAHPTVLRAQEFRHDEALSTDSQSLRTQAFLKTGRGPEQLYAEEAAVLVRYRWAAALFGAWVGLVAGAKLISLSVRRTRTDYEPDRETCVACARCFAYCPQEHERLKRLREGS